MKSKQDIILQLHREGLTGTQIVRKLKVHKSTVYRALKEDITANVSPQRLGHPKSARLKKIIKNIYEKIQQIPQCSIQKLAKKHGISNSSMQRLIKNNRKKKPLENLPSFMLTRFKFDEFYSLRVSQKNGMQETP